MQNTRQQNSAFLRLLLVSALLHGSAVVAYLFSAKTSEVAPQKQTVNVQLMRQPPEPPAPPPQSLPKETPEVVEREQAPKPEEHMPTHNGEEFSSNNQDKTVEGKVVAGGGNLKPDERLKKSETAANAEPQPHPPEKPELNADQPIAEEDVSKATELVSTTGDSFTSSMPSAEVESVDESSSEGLRQESLSAEEFSVDALPTLEELAIPNEFLDGIGNLELLSDGELSDTIVEQPFSESESKELKLVNRYLERMNKQVLAFWINPYQGNTQHRGIIKVELSADGYLENAFIYRSSGHRLLDISVLDAIRAVPRYEVPDNKIITARYYTNLSFHYSSIEEKTELMPFEQEREEVN